MAAFASAAQARATTLIEAGKSISARGDNDSEPDFYYFVGVAGSRVTISLDSPTDALLVLHTPRGEEMLHASGKGEVALEAVLPLTHAFLISVSRADGSRPYTLTYKATEPDVHEMFFAHGIGFSVPRKPHSEQQAYMVKTCWLDPGRKARHVYRAGVQDLSLGRGGIEYATVRVDGRTPRQMERKLEFDGLTATYPVTQSDGSTRYDKRTLGGSDLDGMGPFEGYLCN